jgi:hypothetical protein
MIFNVGPVESDSSREDTSECLSRPRMKHALAPSLTPEHNYGHALVSWISVAAVGVTHEISE